MYTLFNYFKSVKCLPIPELQSLCEYGKAQILSRFATTERNKENKGEVKDPSPERVMTALELSFYLKLPLSTVYSLTKKGIIHGVKFGKHWRYLEREIQEYLLRHSRFPSNPQPAERRAYPRINCMLRAQLVPILYYNGDTERGGAIRNLSAGGALFVPQGLSRSYRKKSIDGIATGGASADFSVGDPVKLIFNLPGPAPRPLEVNGRIVRLAGGKNTCGIKFKTLPPQDAEEIHQYVG